MAARSTGASGPAGADGVAGTNGIDDLGGVDAPDLKDSVNRKCISSI